MNISLRLPAYLAFLVTAMVLAVLPADGQRGREEQFHFKSSKFSGRDLGYLVYKPAGFKSTTRYSLLVYLHGSGSCGDNLDLVKNDGLPRLIEEGKDFPLLIISPQLSVNMNNHWPPDYVNEFILDAVKRLPVDQSRISITGFSMGGTGTWDYACAYPAKIVAAVPLSGWGDKQAVCKMKNIATWVFHGVDDQIVSINGSRSLTNALKNCGGSVLLTELADTGHEAWRKAYSYPNLTAWIVAKRMMSDTVKRVSRVKVNHNTIGHKLPRSLNLITGVDCIGPNDFLGITGRNSRPVVIRFDTLGHVQQMVRIRDASNFSWQDIIHGDNGLFYIGDVGNDNFKRKVFEIYRVREYDLRINEEAVAEKIEFTIDETQPLNFKSLFYADGQLYLFGLSSFNAIVLVRVEDQPGKSVHGIKIKEFKNLNMTSVTASYYDADTKLIYLLDKSQVVVLDAAAGMDIIKDSFKSVIALPNESFKEGLTKLPTGELVYVDQNFLGTSDGNLCVIHRN